jgi:hypothetical protein
MKRASVGSSENSLSDSDGILFKEYYNVRTCTGDPNVGDATNWIWDPATSNATTLGLTIAHIAGLSKLNYKY